MPITSVRTKDSNFEALRTLAVGFVILLHTSGQLLDWSKDTYDLKFWTYNLFDSFSRICVPLFIMISGYFLLSKKENILIFYKKRFKRILIPLIFWTIVFSFFASWMQFGSINFQSMLNGIKIGRPYYHLWYLFMLPGLYLISPLIQLSLCNKNKNHLILLGIGFILISMIYDIIVFRYKFGIPFPFWFMSYLGYYAGGFIIGNLKLNFSKKLNLIIYITGSIAIAYITFLTMKNYNGNQYFYAASSPIVVIITFSFFNFIQKTNISAENWLVKNAKYSFGIYLIHTIPLELIFKYESQLGFSNYNPLIKIILYFSITAAVSLFSSKLIYSGFRKIIE